ncbi:hypothetical protein TNCV_4543171 [Trichonephila clavipes]|nr:hypothetical protein TNCV_4543171 [Trichonephila clavipes]
MDPDAVVQPVTVGEEKGLPRDSSNEQLISADEMCETEVKQKVCLKRPIDRNPNSKTMKAFSSGSVGLGVSKGMAKYSS